MGENKKTKVVILSNSTESTYPPFQQSISFILAQPNTLQRQTIQSFFMHLYLYVCIYIYTSMCTYLFICLFIYLSICLSLSLSL